MPNTSPGYSITVRVEAPAVAHATAALTTAVSSAGGALTALDVAESHADRIVVDVTCDASDVDHADRITEALAQVPGVTVRKVSDRTFLIHLGGKIEVTPKVAAQAPRRPLPRLHPGRRPRVPGDRGATPRTSAGSRSSATPWPWSPTGRRCSAWATSARRRRCR